MRRVVPTCTDCQKTLKATTIDAILAKSDLELGLEVLTDHSLIPQDPPWRTQP
jgi:hypothetical protein